VKQLGANCRCRTANEPIYLEHPKGGDPAEWHQEWRVREFPAAKIFESKTGTNPEPKWGIIS
jgi:hypothetical protein